MLVHLSSGNAKEVVAVELGISPNTVHSHTLRITAKTGAHSLGHALAVAVRRGEVAIEAQPGTPLKLRQQEILACYARGMSPHQTAAHLHVSHQTVKNDVREIYRALRAVSRVHLIYMGLKTGNITINRRKQSEQ